MSNVISLDRLLGDEHAFQPITVTYAIIGGGLDVSAEQTEARKSYLFHYEMFQMNNGFDDALARVTAPIRDLVANDGIPAMPADKKYLFDDNKNIIEIDLYHPTYKPFGCEVPLMIIMTQGIDEEISNTIERKAQVISDTTIQPLEPGETAVRTSVGSGDDGRSRGKPVAISGTATLPKP